MPTEEIKPAETKPGCKPPCVCRMLSGGFIALVGVIGLLAVYGVLSHKAAAIAGSVLLILAGLLTLMRSACKCCDAA